MKFLAIILSVYMTLLSLLPCQDREDMNVAVTYYTIQKSHACNAHRGDVEICSPFCTCACCSVHRIISSHELVYNFHEIAISDKPSFYKSRFPKDVTIAIWQPPQLG